MNFWREAFSENGSGSASRVMMALHSLCACAWITHVVWHANAIPDAVTLSGLAGFITAPYAIGAIKSVGLAAKTGNGGSSNAAAPAAPGTGP